SREPPARRLNAALHGGPIDSVLLRQAADGASMLYRQEPREAATKLREPRWSAGASHACGEFSHLGFRREPAAFLLEPPPTCGATEGVIRRQLILAAPVADALRGR